MAKARKILRRLRSIRNIHEVTRAMYMISTARFKRAHDLLAATRPYLAGVMELAAEAAASGHEGEVLHPLLAGDATSSTDVPPVGTAQDRQGQDLPGAPSARPDAPAAVLLVIASRRGLCGSYNNVVAEHAADRAEELRAAGRKVLLRTSGRRGHFILEALGWVVERAYPQFDRAPEIAVVRQIADGLMEEFLRGAVSSVEAAYMRFVSTGQQKPTIEQILPLKAVPVGPTGRDVAASGPTRGWPPRDQRPVGPEPLPPLFMPSRQEVLRRLIPQAVRARLMAGFLEASASEHVARMTAMRRASDNAEDLIHELTVRYNRARQGQITMELAEIMGGREGVEGA
jgi:F-type H+-transporting ATPase subunit gamma